MWSSIQAYEPVAQGGLIAIGLVAVALLVLSLMALVKFLRSAR